MLLCTSIPAALYVISSFHLRRRTLAEHAELGKHSLVLSPRSRVSTHLDSFKCTLRTGQVYGLHALHAASASARARPWFRRAHSRSGFHHFS
jgi:hypothetical protein